MAKSIDRDRLLWVLLLLALVGWLSFGLSASTVARLTRQADSLICYRPQGPAHCGRQTK